METIRKKAEILAPAGSWECLEAAVACGADAVYFGAEHFNARQGATNFAGDDLKRAMDYCHVRGVHVHLALNTLISDEELPAALDLIRCGCAYGAEAFIVQDLGTARLVHAAAPDTELHASTQMAVMTAAGFEQLRELGFCRAVLPRELSLPEIRAIRQNTGIGLELFVHGALCMCVSGQCYLSAMLGGRSGNRGLCAQPCRLPFGAPGGTGHDLSLKDLDLIDRLPELQDTGIESFKIEGRMKRPEYVAAAVTACKNVLEGRRDDTLHSSLQAVFSRSGFTDGYLTENRGPSMFGTRRKEDVTAADPVLAKLKGLYADTARETGPTGISLDLTAHVGEPLRLRASTGRLTAEAVSEQPAAPAQKKAADPDTVRRQLKKTGGTAFTVMDTELDLGDNVFLPLSELNLLRRNVLQQLTDSIQKRAEKPFFEDRAALPDRLPAYTPAASAAPYRILRFDRAEQLPADAVSDRDRIVLPLDTPEDRLTAVRRLGLPFGVEIPRALYGYTGKIDRQIAAAKECGASFAFAGTLDGVQAAKRQALPVLGGFSMNAFNSLTLQALEDLGLAGITVSEELRLLEIGRLRGTLPRGILAYGRTPLMLVRNCPIRNGLSCRDCGRQQALTDRKGVEFPVRCCSGASDILNSRPIWLADRLTELPPLDFLVLYFTVETAGQTASVLKAYDTGGACPGEFTRGLYYRGVQ